MEPENYQPPVHPNAKLDIAAAKAYSTQPLPLNSRGEAMVKGLGQIRLTDE